MLSLLNQNKIKELIFNNQFYKMYKIIYYLIFNSTI